MVLYSQAGTGICLPKCHLLAGLLRAQDIPAGFRYQVLTRDFSIDKEKLAYDLDPEKGEFIYPKVLNRGIIDELIESI